MAECIFVRHAATTWSGHRFCGRADPPLHRAGRLTARRLAADLVAHFDRGSPPAVRLVSSPARRAQQTARAIELAMPGLRMELDERWSEADVGVAEGLTFAQLNAVDPDLARRLADGEVQIDWPAGETASALAGRVEAALRDLDDGPAPAIVVSHAGPLRIAIALASAVPVEQVAFLEPGAFLVCPSDVGARVGRGRMLRFRS